MPHETALIVTLAAGLGLAFVFGLAAVRVRLPPILGYLLAGVAVGPFTPGYVADSGLAAQLAEIGVILLMFGVGLHFSIRDLLAVRRIAIPGALAQIAAATLLGTLVSLAWGWSWGTGLVFGLALSVASTVVLLRALEDRGILESSDGRIAVGWLIVEDLVTVIALVLLPALAPMLAAPLASEPAVAGQAATSAAAHLGGDNIGVVLMLTLLKVAAFVVFMLLVGRRAIPWLLGRVVNTGSRELFTLAVLALALGIATGAAALFGVSFALGAFFAGVIVSESDFSHEAATNALPLQDAFAVLFFVSVGMLFDPSMLLSNPFRILAVLAIIMIGKSIASLAIVLLFRYPLRTALTISASLAQIGEFSFILAGLALSLGLLPVEAQGYVVAGAILSITFNPFVFQTLAPIERWVRRRPRLTSALERPAGELATLPPSVPDDALADHVVLIGHGRVGAPIAQELARHNVPHVVVEQIYQEVQDLRKRGVPAIYGDATRPDILTAAHLERARLVVIAAPDAYQSRVITQFARTSNPDIQIIVRTHSDDEREFLEQHGANLAFVGERELAVSLTRAVLHGIDIPVDMQGVASRQSRA